MTNLALCVAPESHRAYNWRMSLEYLAERNTVQILTELFPDLIIHMSPYARIRGFTKKLDSRNQTQISHPYRTHTMPSKNGDEWERILFWKTPVNKYVYVDYGTGERGGCQI